MDTLFLPDHLRSELKSPLGLLIRGSVDETVSKLRELIDSMKPEKIISVGDVISESMLSKGLKVDVFIVDNKSMRKPREPLCFKVDKIFTLTNPAGTINSEAWHVIGEAINSKGLVKVLVYGEEDLLTMVAVLLAPENSIVVYGQPDEGVVVIKVDEKSKERISEILGKMERRPEN